MKLTTFLYPDIYKELPTGTYNVILIDPPWAYTDRINDHSRGAINHYPTLTSDQLKAFPMEQFVHANTFLFFWTTKDFRGDAIQLMASWGFIFKTEFIWVKIKKGIDDISFKGNDLASALRMGMGHYNRLCHEFLLLGVRKDRDEFPLNAKHELSVFFAPIREHSEKPEESYQLIERNAKPPFLEMFARKPRDGWTTWGNELSGDDDHPDR